MQVQTSDRLRDESRPIKRNRAGANETSTAMHFTLTQSRRRTNTEPRNWNALDAPRTPTTGAKRVRNDRAEEAKRDPHDTLTRAHGEMNEAQNVRDITVPPDTDTNTNANTTIKRGDRLRAHPTRAHGTTLAQWIGCPHWTWYWKVPTRKSGRCRRRRIGDEHRREREQRGMIRRQTLGRSGVDRGTRADSARPRQRLHGVVERAYPESDGAKRRNVHTPR